MNSGVWIDWSTYEITQRMSEPERDRSDVAGRCRSRAAARWCRSDAMRAAGNVDPDRLPHYAADYEFSLRLARHGCPLMMTNRTSIEVDWDLDVLAAVSRPASFGRMWWELTNERSFANVPIHFTLIDLAGPPRDRRKLKVRGARSPIRLDQATHPGRAMWWAWTARALVAGRRALTRLRRVESQAVVEAPKLITRVPFWLAYAQAVQPGRVRRDPGVQPGRHDASLPRRTPWTDVSEHPDRRGRRRLHRRHRRASEPDE